jgi:hypothetical protein
MSMNLSSVISLTGRLPEISLCAIESSWDVFHCHRKKIKENVQINPVRFAEKPLHMVSRLDGMHLILTKLNGLDLNRIKLLKCGKTGRLIFSLVFCLITLCNFLIFKGSFTYESHVTIYHKVS